MSLKWIGTTCLIGLFALFVILPSALVCGLSVQLVVAFLLGAAVSYLLFSAAEQHETRQATSSEDRAEGPMAPISTRRKALTLAVLALVMWVPYVITLLSLGWTGGWWVLPGVFFLVSVAIILDIVGPVFRDA